MKKQFISLFLITCSAIFGSCSTAKETSKESHSQSVDEMFHISFYDDDKVTLLYSEDLPRGQMPVYRGEVPKKNATVEYTYQFEGWEPTLYQATKNQNYYARYKKIMNEQTSPKTANG